MRCSAGGERSHPAVRWEQGGARKHEQGVRCGWKAYTALLVRVQSTVDVHSPGCSASINHCVVEGMPTSSLKLTA